MERTVQFVRDSFMVGLKYNSLADLKDTPLTVDRTTTLAEYVQMWLRDIAPDKLAKSTLARDKQDIDRFLPYLGGDKLTELRPEHFRKLCAELRKQTSQNTECRFPSTR